MLCSALFKRVGVSLSLVFYVAIHPTSVLPVGKSRNGPPQSMPFCPFHPHTRAGNSPSFFPIISLPRWEYNCGSFSFYFVTDHDHSLCMPAPIDAPSDIPMLFVLLLPSDLPLNNFFFSPHSVNHLSHERCRESNPTRPEKKIGENKNRINSQIISNAHRVFMVEFSALDKNKKNGYRLQLKLSSLIFDIYLWNI